MNQLKALDEEVKWWRYMAAFDAEDCLEREDVKDCSGSVMRSVGVTQHIVDEVN